MRHLSEAGQPETGGLCVPPESRESSRMCRVSDERPTSAGKPARRVWGRPHELRFSVLQGHLDSRPPKRRFQHRTKIDNCRWSDIRFKGSRNGGGLVEVAGTDVERTGPCMYARTVRGSQWIGIAC